MSSTAYQFSPSVLESLSEPSQRCIDRLRVHEPERIDLSDRPTARLAAVLVLLYEKAGKLRVLLTTRSKLLRAHPGQTALPGGKVDETDANVTETAYREAHEEVALPLNCPHIHTVTIMRPYLSSSKLLVTPVVALLTDLSVLDDLKASESEVSCIFEHPLEAILDPSLMRDEPLVKKGSEDWLYEQDLHCTSDIFLGWLGNSTYRMHRFRSSASPVKGLTSDILIAAAEIAYDRQPSYERYAPGQLRGFASILRILESDEVTQHAASGTSTPKIEVGVAASQAAPSLPSQP